jgi:hypothetical protein
MAGKLVGNSLKYFSEIIRFKEEDKKLDYPVTEKH